MPALLCGCVAAWHRVDLNTPQPLSPTQQIEIWRVDSVRWGDSAAGFFKTAGLTLLTASSVVFAVAVVQALGRD